jgi:transcriptional regulator with XRE-family HTH domain
VDDQRVGAALRAVRHHRRLRQRDVATRAHLSAATISRAEAGHLDTLSLRSVRQIGAALDVRLDLVARWRGGEIDRLLDAGHAQLEGAVIRRLTLAGWDAAPEASFSIYGERGSIDVLARHPGTGALLVVEVKTRLIDLQNLISVVDRKRRLASQVAAERGWPAAEPLARHTSVWVALASTRTNQRHVAAHADVLRAAFPADRRQLDAWLQRPEAPLAALSFLPLLHRGQARRQVRQPMGR